jgi:hypothetical protein
MRAGVFLYAYLAAAAVASVATAAVVQSTISNVVPRMDRCVRARVC